MGLLLFPSSIPDLNKVGWGGLRAPSHRPFLGILPGFPWALASICSLGRLARAISIGEYEWPGEGKKWPWLPLTSFFTAFIYPELHAREVKCQALDSFALGPAVCCEESQPLLLVNTLTYYSASSSFQFLSCFAHCKHVTWEGKADFRDSTCSIQGCLLVKRLVEFGKGSGLFFPLIQLCLLAGKKGLDSSHYSWLLGSSSFNCS